MSSILEIKNLNAGYKDLQILNNVSLKLRDKSISVLMGPNGAGKSTLLKSIYNLVDIDSGSVIYNGENITKKPAHQLLELGVSFVSQGKTNFDTLTVEENLEIGAHHINNEKEVENKKKEIYSELPVLEKKRKEYAFNLSGGQQQMLAIGRSLMSSPKLLLMDEPSLGLAPKLVKKVFDKIVDINKNFDTAILIVEHNIKSLIEIADFGFILVNGKLVDEGKCDKLKNSEIMKKVFVGNFE